MSIKNIFFDLDGTIINSSPGIFHCIDYALAQNGFEPCGDIKKRTFIGPPLYDTFYKYCGDEQAARRCTDSFRYMYQREGVKMNRLYDGVKDMLAELSDAGRTLFIATSKPEKFAKIILKDLGVAQYFCDICGATLDDSRVTKRDVLSYAMAKNDITAPSNCLMIGDTDNDILGAAALSIRAVGVAWGFGSADSMLGAGALKICDEPRSTAKYILSL